MPIVICRRPEFKGRCTRADTWSTAFWASHCTLNIYTVKSHSSCTHRTGQVTDYQDIPDYNTVPILT